MPEGIPSDSSASPDTGSQVAPYRSPGTAAATQVNGAVRKYGNHAITVIIGAALLGLWNFYDETHDAILQLQAENVSQELRFAAQDQALLGELEDVNEKLGKLEEVIDDLFPRKPQ